MERACRLSHLAWIPEPCQHWHHPERRGIAGVVNLPVAQRLDTGVGRVGRGTELRFDVLNVGDTVYQIRNGTGLAPQFGLRRTALAGLTQRF
jgi:hypothetical protein